MPVRFSTPVTAWIASGFGSLMSTFSTSPERTIAIGFAAASVATPGWYVVGIAEVLAG